MSAIEAEIMDALTMNPTLAGQFSRCAPGSAEAITKTAMSTFVRGNPRSWWLSLKPSCACSIYEYPEGDGFEHVAHHVPHANGTCWFIPETEEEPLPVFDCNIDAVAALMRECFRFEYYLVGKQFDWMAIDNDHNQIIVCSAQSDRNLRKC